MPSRRTPAVRVIPYAATSSPVTSGALALKPARPPVGLERPNDGRRRVPVTSRSVPRPAAVLWAVDGSPADEDLAGTLSAVVRLIGEVLAGARPVRHLARCATVNVYRELAPYVPPAPVGAQVRPPKVLTTWAQQPAPGAVEGGAVIRLNGRVQAFALRLEHHRGRWLCTALETTTPAL